jgi:hypothetical protein
VRGLTEPDPSKALEACRSFAVSMDDDGDNAAADGGGAAPAPGGDGNGAKTRLPLVDRIERGRPLLLFVAGDRSKVGKSRCVREREREKKGGGE